MQDTGRLGPTDGRREWRGEVGVGLGRHHGKWVSRCAQLPC